MNELPRNDVLKILKQQFLSGNLKEYDHKYDKTVAAWEKARAAGAEAMSRRIWQCRHTASEYRNSAPPRH